MKALNNNSLEIDGFIISQSLHNTVNSLSLFGISKKDNAHLGHDDIKWAINSDIICNGCNICDSCQGDCHSSCQGTCTSGCQGSCHSSCQGGCTNGCQGCVGCYGGCTSGCNNGCYSGCTSKCVGCHSCNECQSCVGANCNSVNGMCHPSVACLVSKCTSCYMEATGCGGGCTGSCQQSTSTPANITNPTITPVSIESFSCSCYGCQNTVSGGNGCNANHGYGGTNTIIVTLSNGSTFEMKVEGEKIVSCGGSQRGSGDLKKDALALLNAYNAEHGTKYKADKDTTLDLKDENGNPIQSKTLGSLQQYDMGAPTSVMCSSDTGITTTCYGCASGYVVTRPNPGCSSLI